MILQSGLPILVSLILLWLAIVLADRHHRRERRLGVERHLRSVGPMDEGWLIEHREREGRE